MERSQKCGAIRASRRRSEAALTFTLNLSQAECVYDYVFIEGGGVDHCQRCFLGGRLIIHEMAGETQRFAWCVKTSLHVFACLYAAAQHEHSPHSKDKWWDHFSFALRSLHKYKMDFLSSGMSPLKLWSVSSVLDRLLLNLFSKKKSTRVVQTKQNWDAVKMSSKIHPQGPPQCFSLNEMLSD